MTDSHWQLLTTTPNVPSAKALKLMLENQGVACRIDTGPALLGDAQSCAVMVEGMQLHRAQSLLTQADFSDAELEFLATGAVSCSDAREKP